MQHRSLKRRLWDRRHASPAQAEPRRATWQVEANVGTIVSSGVAFLALLFGAVQFGRSMEAQSKALHLQQQAPQSDRASRAADIYGMYLDVAHTRPPSRIVAHALLVLLASFACAASAQCFVKDPDLQGSYSGGCVNGMANGLGTARGRDEYVGEFKDGATNGAGVYTWGATSSWPGDRAEGRFRAGAHVQGTYTDRDGFVTDGLFRRSKLHGLGVLRVPLAKAVTISRSWPAYQIPWKEENGAMVWRGIFDEGELVAPCESEQQCFDMEAVENAKEALVCESVALARQQYEQDASSFAALDSAGLYQRASPLARRGTSLESFSELMHHTQEELALSYVSAKLTNEIFLSNQVPLDHARLLLPAIERSQEEQDPGAVLRYWDRLCDQE